MWVVGSLNVFHVGGSPGKYTCLKLYLSVSSQTAFIRINRHSKKKGFISALSGLFGIDYRNLTK